MGVEEVPVAHRAAEGVAGRGLRRIEELPHLAGVDRVRQHLAAVVHVVPREGLRLRVHAAAHDLLGVGALEEVSLGVASQQLRAPTQLDLEVAEGLHLAPVGDGRLEAVGDDVHRRGIDRCAVLRGDLAEGLLVEGDQLGAADAGSLGIEREIDVGLGVDLGLVGPRPEIVDAQLALAPRLELLGHQVDRLVLDLLAQLADLLALRRADRGAEHAVDHGEVAGEPVDLHHVALRQWTLARLQEVGDRLLPRSDFGRRQLDMAMVAGVGGGRLTLLVVAVPGLEAEAHPLGGEGLLVLLLRVLVLLDVVAGDVAGRVVRRRPRRGEHRGRRDQQRENEEKGKEAAGKPVRRAGDPHRNCPPGVCGRNCARARCRPDYKGGKASAGREG